MKKILAVIPARGGSKGLPRKNILKINGCPLIEYTINAALEANGLTDVVVSTDDSEIAEISKALGAQVPFMRPGELASDMSQSAPVVVHAMKEMEEIKGYRYHAIMMLQPTSPLRTSDHIEKALELFFSQECDSVVSVASVGGVHPFRMKKLVGDQLVNYIDQGFWDMRPRQVLPDIYIRNGSIYMIRRDILIEKGQLIGKKCLGLVMSDEESVNIDSPLEFKLAELLFKEKDN
jgi:CMP-N,N'-diacetyllegionaminic acid synthase